MLCRVVVIVAVVVGGVVVATAEPIVEAGRCRRSQAGATGNYPASAGTGCTRTGARPTARRTQQGCCAQ